MDDLDALVVSARSDPKIFEELVEKQHKFLVHCAYHATNRYISPNEDEWSETLLAYYDAVHTYDSSKGAFSPYAKVVITRRLVDYYRKKQKWSSEILTDPGDFTDQGIDDKNNSMKKQIEDKICSKEEVSASDEIEEIQILLKEYGFSFWDLSEASPRTKGTKEKCKTAIQCMMESTQLQQELKSKKQLPIKDIKKSTGLPPKFLDKYRRYIITAVEILSGEYPKLWEYLNDYRK